MASNVTTRVGTNGNDILQGTSLDDVLIGLDGRDRLLAGSGDDVLFGGDGDDRLSGGAGNDVLFGGGDRNTLFGGIGADRFVLETDTAQIIGDFDTVARDRVVIAIPELLDADGAPEADLLRGRDSGSNLLLEALLDGTFTTLANIRGAAGLDLEEVVLRPGRDIPGDPSSSAVLRIGGEERGTVERPGDEDWFRVDLEAGATYVFTLEGDAAADQPLDDPLFRLYDTQARLIAEDDDGGPGVSSRLVFQATEDQTLFASAGGFGIETGDYQLGVDIESFVA